VILPPGKWFDFYTGNLAGEGTITISAGLEKIPLFVRDGGLIPMISPIRQTSEWKNDMPLIVRVYGKADGHYNLYNDDGKSFNFEKGEYSAQVLEIKAGQSSVRQTQTASFGYTGITWKFMTE
jgi:alpha-D-xyloside xylohydrolase